jgi:phenylalanyl-tRNA synthetase beta chain
MSAEVWVGDTLAGWVGAIHPQFNKLLGINGRIFVFELRLAAVSERVLPSAQSVSKYPANRRDIAILVRDEVTVGDVLDCIKKVGVNQLVALNLFDVYNGQGIAQGYKSLALSLILQDANKTLEEAEIQQSVNQVVQALATTFNAALRE